MTYFTDTNKLSKRNAKTITTRKVFPMHRKRLPSDSRHRNAKKNGSFFRQYVHGKDRNRWHGNDISISEQISPYNEIYS